MRRTSTFVCLAGEWSSLPARRSSRLKHEFVGSLSSGKCSLRECCNPRLVLRVVAVTRHSDDLGGAYKVFYGHGLRRGVCSGRGLKSTSRGTTCVHPERGLEYVPSRTEGVSLRARGPRPHIPSKQASKREL